MDIRIFKLITGEEVMGEVTHTIDNQSVIKNPAVIIMQPDSSGRPSLGLMDYLPFSEKREVHINLDHVITSYIPKATLINHYNQLYGTGLVLPSKSGLIV